MCVGGTFLRDPLVGSFLLLAGVLSFILGMLVSMLVGKRCVQPGCYGRVRQIHDIKEEDKIASKEKWTAFSSINECFFGRCERCGEIYAWRDRSRDRDRGGG